MYDYGEYCPVSKATSLLCERWTLQIIREMLLGVSRFSEFQKYLPRISPSLLNSRLRLLVKNGIAVRKRIPDRRGFEYFLTPAGKSLSPLVSELGNWGKTWVYEAAGIEALDVESLLRAISMTIAEEKLPAGDTILQFKFSDLKQSPRWYITIKKGKREVCDVDLGYEVDVYFESTLAVLDSIWWGRTSLADARQNGAFKVTGPSAYTRRLSSWFPTQAFAGCAEENAAQAVVASKLT